MKIALGGLKSPIKNLQQHGGEEKEKTAQKGLMGRPAQQIHRRQQGSKKKVVQQHQPHGGHHCGPVAWFMGPRQPLPLGTPTVPPSNCPQPQLAALHPRVHPAPEPAWLLRAPQQTTALLPHLRLSTQHCCRPASTLGTGAAADPQEPAL